jgi:hypothetical protein
MRAWLVAWYGREDECKQGFGGKPEGRGPLGRRRRRCNNVNINVREIGLRGLKWIRLAQDRDQWRALVNTIVNLGLHKMLDISLRGRATVCVSCKTKLH